MLDEKVIIESPEVEQEETNKAVDQELQNYPITESTESLQNQIIEAPDSQSLQKCLDIFNLTQSKKNALRAIKLNSLLDAVEDQAIERFKKRPDQISNKELLDYMQVVSAQIERSQKASEQLNSKPAIQINQQKNEVNVNIGAGLDKESKDRVIEAVQALLQQAKNQQSETSSNSLIDFSSDNENCIIDESDSTLLENSEDVEE